MVNKLKELRSTGAEEGFTLIELMIVVVIIGILAAIAIPIFANQQKSAITSGVKSDVKNTNTNIATALVKAPTAAEVKGTTTGSNGTGLVGPVGATASTAKGTFDIVVSDAGTTISVDGAWNTYKVEGSNAASDLAGKWTYSVASGKASDVTPAPPAGN